MKTQLSSLVKFLALAVILVSVVFACQKLNPLEGIDVTVTDDVAVSPMLIRFSNANPSGTTLPDFDVTISGPNAALVKSDGGATTFKAQAGYLPLYLTTDAHPTTANPVKFNIYAAISGFAPVSQLITVTADSVKVIDITVVELAKPASGTGVTTSQASLSSGTVTTPQVIKTETNTDMAQSTTVTLPTGTKIQDASGNNISASQITATVVHINPNNPTSYSAFPGGYEPSNIVDQSGAALPAGKFVSAGLVAINMDAGGTAVKKFSSPINVSMDVDPNTSNPLTGDNLKAGDVVPLWSLDEQTGQWKSEGTVTLKNTNGKLTADFTTTHLSCFNLDWFFYPSDKIGTCSAPLTVTLNIGAGKRGTYDVALVTPTNQYLAAAHWVDINAERVITFPNVPKLAKVKIVMSDFNLWLNPRLPILASTPIFDPCATNAVTLSYGNAPTPAPRVNMELTVTGKCTNKNVKILPSGWYNIINAATNKIAASIQLANGVIAAIIPGTGVGFQKQGTKYLISIESGSYYLSTNYNNKLNKSPVITIGPANFTIPTNSLGITGAGVYSAATNTITVTANISPNCN